MAKNNLLGPWGETLAAQFLRKKRYEVLACNYRCRLGEVDLICRSRRYLVFVEVKLRKSDRFGEGREFVGFDKQNRIRATAELWMQQNPCDLQPRFDVIEIYAPEGMMTEHPKIIHLEDAFQ